MAARGRYYAVAATLRQLIECEYLVILFAQDLHHATTWSASSPRQIREGLSPAKMTKRLPSLADREYWHHCDRGGHPAPSGSSLIESNDPDRTTWPYTSAAILVDLSRNTR